MNPIIDLSEHEGTIDFKALAPKVAGVILRLGYGEQKDARLEEYYEAARAENIPCGAYHFPIDQRSVTGQVNKVTGWIDGKDFELGLAVDVEAPSPQHTQSPGMIDAYLSALQGKLGIKPMIYTSDTMWKRIMGTAPYYTDYLLWIAHYTEGNPILPAGAKAWTFWQYSEDGQAPGTTAALDLNNYNIQMLSLIQPVKTNAVEINKPLGKLITTNTTLMLAVRISPVSGAVVRWLGAASIVEYYEKNTLGWFRIGHDEWISGAWARVMETYPTEPLPEPEPNPDPDSYLFEVMVTTGYDYLPIRTEPAMTATEVGRLENGEKAKVYQATKNRWYKIGENRWIFGQNCSSLAEPLTSLRYPMAQEFRISQLFGKNTGSYYTANGHNGVDYACYAKTELIAAASGFVETVELTTVYGYGRHCRIRVQGGVLIYGHMLEVFVKEGDRITEGQVLGLSDGAVGMPYAGNSTGNHLHFEYRLDRPIVPEGYGNRYYWAIDTLPITRKLGE